MLIVIVFTSCRLPLSRHSNTGQFCPQFRFCRKHCLASRPTRMWEPVECLIYKHLKRIYLYTILYSCLLNLYEHLLRYPIWEIQSSNMRISSSEIHDSTRHIWAVFFSSQIYSCRLHQKLLHQSFQVKKLYCTKSSTLRTIQGHCQQTPLAHLRI